MGRARKVFKRYALLGDYKDKKNVILDYQSDKEELKIPCKQFIPDNQYIERIELPFHNVKLPLNYYVSFENTKNEITDFQTPYDNLDEIYKLSQHIIEDSRFREDTVKCIYITILFNTYNLGLEKVSLVARVDIYSQEGCFKSLKDIVEEIEI